MSYQFNYIYHEKLAKLAWGMVITLGEKIVDVHIGSMVEHCKDFFVSGVWDGPFAEAGFDEAEMFCGCGVKLVEDKIVAYTATHERQRICYMKKQNKVYVTNSIPFLLALTEENLDIDCDQYERILCSVIDGLEDYEKNIPLAGGAVMHQLFSSDLSIDQELNCQIKRKPQHRDFVDFQDYYQSMLQVCEKIRDNGMDPYRKYLYGMVTTASSGYDSSSCAAIVRQIGCDTACTFRNGKYDEDSAVDILKQLGYPNIVERSYLDYKAEENNLDAVYFADGDLGFFMPFAGFKNEFFGKILVTGISGSYMWDRDSKVNPDSKREGYYFYTANLSFNEHAIQNGYMMLPLVLYGSTAAVSIQKISNAAEMEPWTLHTDYDRPIPRRILETAGVARESFGHVNRGAGISFSRNFTDKQVKYKMTPSGYEDFKQWLNQKGNNRWGWKRMIHAIQYHVSTIPEYMDYICSRMHRSTSFSKGHPNLYPNPGLPAKMVIWGILCETEKYKQNLIEC